MSEFVKGTWELGAGIGTGAGETEETGCSSWLVGVEAIINKDQQQKLLTYPGYDDKIFRLGHTNKKHLVPNVGLGGKLLFVQKKKYTWLP